MPTVDTGGIIPFSLLTKNAAEKCPHNKLYLLLMQVEGLASVCKSINKILTEICYDTISILFQINN